jgi:hypothetical protein
VQGGEVGHLPQAQRAAQVVQVLGDAAVVGLEEGLEGQAGKQLGLRVQLGAAAVRVEAEHVTASGQGVADNAERGFGGGTHTPF